MPNFARRKYIVDNMQYRLIGVGLIHFLLGALVFGIALFVPVVIQLQSGELTSPQVQKAAGDFLALHNRIWPPALAVLIFVVVNNVLVSHRIAGPLYRFRNVLKTIGYGDLSNRVRLRKKDYLTKEAQVINEMMEALRARVEELDGHNRETDAALSRLQNSLADGSLTDVARCANDVEDCLETLNKSLSRFDTGKPHKPLREVPAPANASEPESTAAMELVPADDG